MARARNTCLTTATVQTKQQHPDQLSHKQGVDQ